LLSRISFFRRTRLKPDAKGSRVTGKKPAWWLSGYPEEIEEVSEPEPAITQEKLDALELDDAVFHKAFGYGRIVGLDDKYIHVAFDDDDKKKKPSRMFPFPGAFYQGLLQIG